MSAPTSAMGLGNLELPGKVGIGALSAQEVSLAKSLRGTKDSNAIANQLFWGRHPELNGEKLRDPDGPLAKEWSSIRDGVEANHIADRMSAGNEPTNATANEVFWARHPEMRDKAIKANQTDLAQEWLAIRGRVEEKRADKLIQGGQSDANALTNELFWSRHPDMRGKKIESSQSDFASEWKDLKSVAEKRLQPLHDLKSSPSFAALNPDNQSKAIGLFQANYADPVARERAKSALDALAPLKGSGAKGDVLDALTQASPLNEAELKQTASLLRAVQSSSASDQKLVTETILRSKANPQIAKAMEGLIHSDGFGKIKDPAANSDVLRALTNASPLSLDALAKTQTLLGSSGFKSLSRPDQKLVTETLAGAKDLSAVASSCQSLLADPWLQDLKPAKKTAVLSQARNYPDPRSVENLERLVQKGWFRRSSVEDVQRSAKTVACLSQHPGDRGVIENTLDQILSPGAKVRLSWRELDGSYGEAGLIRMRLNENLLSANNSPVNGSFQETHLVLHTVAHEVNHLLGNDKVRPTFEYLQEEYRSWYVGTLAEHGRPPTNEETMGRWGNFLLPGGGYYKTAGKRALKNDDEAAQIFAFLSQVTGLPVNASNYTNVLTSAPSTWTTPSWASAPVPPGNLDNH